MECSSLFSCLFTVNCLTFYLHLLHLEKDPLCTMWSWWLLMENKRITFWLMTVDGKCGVDDCWWKKHLNIVLKKCRFRIHFLNFLTSQTLLLLILYLLYCGVLLKHCLARGYIYKVLVYRLSTFWFCLVETFSVIHLPSSIKFEDMASLQLVAFLLSHEIPVIFQKVILLYL